MRGTLVRDFYRKRKWAILRGRPADLNATIYRLNFHKVEKPLFLLKADDNILFFLHNDGSLMVGNSETAGKKFKYATGANIRREAVEARFP